MSDADSIRAIQDQMRTVRRELGSDLASSARDITDWRAFVRANPLVCLGVAAAVGYLLAPKGPSVVRLSDLDLQALLRQNKVVASGTTAPRTRPASRLRSALLSNLGALAMRGALAYIGHRFANAKLHPEPQEQTPF
jgi:hypothetical protein